MKKTGLYIAFAFIILLMLLPALQMQFGFITEAPLNGAFNLTEKPTFTKDKWISGEFQGQVEKYFKDRAGFHNLLVRLQNQLDFNFFRKANAEGAVVGKNRQLFEYDYIRSWLAIDYPGDSFVGKKLQRLKYVQEYMKREKGINLVLVFEPGKASFYPEYIPSVYKKKKSGPSTYDRYLQKTMELGIDYIDFHQYFLQLKGTSEYPLFPRYGTHWSEYGMQFAADSLLRWIEGRLGQPLADFPLADFPLADFPLADFSLTSVRVDTTIISTKPLSTDDDVLKTMNLLFPLKGEKLAYPELAFDTAHPGIKPMVLVVADSYYWNIFNTRIPKYIFANEAFWYFNALVYPDHYLKPTYTKDLDIKSEVEKQDFIFLMITERFLHKFDWGFIDQLYSLYTPHYLQDPVYSKINNIMQVATWYTEVINKAARKGISLEDALLEEGQYLMSNDDTLTYFVNYGPEHFRKIIANDEKWMGSIREKALAQGTSEEDMLMSNALYIFNQNYPDIYKMNRGMEKMKDLIYSDEKLLDSLKAEAGKYRWDIEAFVKLSAWQMYREEQINATIKSIYNYPVWLEDVTRKALKKGISVEEMARLDAEYMWEQRLK